MVHSAGSVSTIACSLPNVDRPLSSGPRFARTSSRSGIVASARWIGVGSSAGPNAWAEIGAQAVRSIRRMISAWIHVSAPSGGAVGVFRYSTGCRSRSWQSTPACMGAMYRAGRPWPSDSRLATVRASVRTDRGRSPCPVVGGPSPRPALRRRRLAGRCRARAGRPDRVPDGADRVGLGGDGTPPDRGSRHGDPLRRAHPGPRRGGGHRRHPRRPRRRSTTRPTCARSTSSPTTARDRTVELVRPPASTCARTARATGARGRRCSGCSMRCSPTPRAGRPIDAVVIVDADTVVAPGVPRGRRRPAGGGGRPSCRASTGCATPAPPRPRHCAAPRSRCATTSGRSGAPRSAARAGCSATAWRSAPTSCGRAPGPTT